MSDEPELEEPSIDDAEYRRSLEQALDTLNMGVVITHAGQIVYASPTQLRLIGRSLEELRTVSTISLVADEAQRAHLASRIEQRKPGDRPHTSYEIRATHGDGHEVDLHIANVPLSNAGRHTLSLVRDITEDRILARRIGQRHRMEAIGQLCSGITHDFNNYLTALRLISESLATAAPEEVPALVAELDEVTAGAARLTRQLQTFAGGEVHRGAVLDLNIVVFEMAAMLRRLTGRHIELALNLEPGLPPTEIDAAQLQQILVNLVVNAGIAIGAAGGRITVQTQTEGGHIVLTVTDDGEGMDDVTLERAFEPLFTTHPETASGMGLAIVYGIVRQFGGDVEIESRAGEGTAARVRFPIAQHSGSSSRARGAQPTHVRSVLIVERAPNFGGLVEAGLRREGFSVTRTSVDDLPAVLGKPFDALIVDVEPPSDPSSAVSEFRRQFPTATVIYVSKPPTIGEEEWDSGVFAVVPKPFSVAELVAAIRRETP